MKVLSYMQFVLYEFDPESLEDYMIASGIWNTNFVNHKKQTEYLSNYDLYNLAQAHYLDWCSQSFKPEMIKELFKEIPSYENTFVVSTKEYPYKPGNEFDITIKETPYDFIRGKFINVRTLDDFITDCQRAGIELEWRSK